ncbi:Uncharacterised protein [Vibrio cholerae]|uniref:Uncharacterized protein n=1 Tax=Vibrio cholerae TaxID=666 RepID=A0A655X8Y9_VIBCL|nr:Uncharacterised protein [Vibrio cholerae]CSC22240.1 Uncharacterised protein [Vibrio cholerae]CSD17609.1 Uncharacterised protein [Vibrio cholerae]CSI68076.1 Uncharacterised protein [Vibrio cholerae]
MADACGNLVDSLFGKVSIRKASTATSCVAEAIAIPKANMEVSIRLLAGLTPAMSNVQTRTMDWQKKIQLRR